MTGTDGARSTDQLMADNNLLNLVTQNVLESLGETLELLLLFLTSLLLLLSLLKLEVFGDINKLPVLVFADNLTS